MIQQPALLRFVDRLDRVQDAGDVAVKKAVYGALNLYLDFINLFLFLLRFLGVARSE